MIEKTGEASIINEVLLENKDDDEYNPYIIDLFRLNWIEGVMGR